MPETSLDVLAAGADAARIGTRFLATIEANIHPQYQRALIEAGVEDTVLTTTFSVGWHTGALALHYRESPQQHRRAEHRPASFPRHVNRIRQLILAMQRLVQPHSGEPAHPAVDDSRPQFIRGTPAASGSADQPPLLTTNGS